MIEVLCRGPTALEGSRSPYGGGEDRRMKEGGGGGPSSNGGKRAPPRRSQTQHEYFLPQSPAFAMFTIPQSPPATEDRPPQWPSSPATPDSAAAGEKDAERSRAAARRPPLGPPRRSYSVTDQQPIPRRHPPPATGLALLDLPAELHFSIMDFLDPIDSACLGLANKHFYAIHRRLHGTVPLTARRSGPNELEWAWHLAGNVVVRKGPAGEDVSATAAAAAAEDKTAALSRLRVRGQGYCRMCGVTRCQLHKHIQEWMGEGWEYCSVKQRFGPAAPEGAKSYCYMSKPGDARRCGRHGVRASRVELR
ncbi:hypothetical protein C8A05DRAFT_29395 [Staphylotrichum tortipilum]|uniref:F-box domain-containing protein n=1 Tax=Staphylotrichum tortipilum TaxID=2831512 RepID=A0AAN6RYE1_9PEZI|nr:hypothetical protein C8A05DRAFT_29395 [Staphylotrichum longicolle]